MVKILESHALFPVLTSHLLQCLLFQRIPQMLITSYLMKHGLLGHTCHDLTTQTGRIIHRPSLWTVSQNLRYPLIRRYQCCSLIPSILNVHIISIHRTTGFRFRLKPTHFHFLAYLYTYPVYRFGIPRNPVDKPLRNVYDIAFRQLIVSTIGHTGILLRSQNDTGRFTQIVSYNSNSFFLARNQDQTHSHN